MIHTSLAFVFGLLLGGSSVVWIFRRVYRNRSGELISYQQELVAYKKELQELKKAINNLLFEVSHNGLNPVMKTFRGLRSLLQKNRPKIKEDLAQAIKPNHHRYAELAQKRFEEMNEALDKTEETCLNAEKKLSESVKRLNELL